MNKLSLMHALFAIGSLAASDPGAMAQDSLAANPDPQELSTDAWESIRSAHHANQHKAVAHGDGYHARNPGQKWTTHFDGQGFLVRPDHGEWTWGLQLQSFGFEDRPQTHESIAGVSAKGDRVTYRWSANLLEWYINDGRGLEHGYTVLERPSASADPVGPLTFTLGVEGDLGMELLSDARGVRFLDGKGAAVLTYAGLHVFDADGTTLPAAFERSGDRLRISINEVGAKYPLTIDPIAQQAYLKASNTETGDQFGWSVAVDGDRVAVSAPGEDSLSTGVNGGQGNDQQSEDSGAVYLFERAGGAWTQVAYIKASNAGPGDHFGSAVSLSGNLLIVGAHFEDGGATGVNGDQNLGGPGSSGAVYVFEEIGGVWSQQAYIKASNTHGLNFFGVACAISGDLIVVGAPGEQSAGVGVDGNQTQTGLTATGAAYVFERQAGVWSQQAYLKASNPDMFDSFGRAVSIAGETVVVGAVGERSSATGVDGNQGDNSAPFAGATYVFQRSGGVWAQEAYLKASNTEIGDSFGISVDIDGDHIVVGALGEGSGIVGDPSDNSLAEAGAAYVFERTAGVWSQQAYLKAANVENIDGFGLRVAIAGDRLAVGAFNEDGGSTGVNGNPNDNGASNSGAVYVFELIGSSWSQTGYLKAPNPTANMDFGTGLDMAGDLLVVGANGEKSSAMGVNGDPFDASLSLAGAAFVFDLDAPMGTFCDPAEVNSSGMPATLSMSGSLPVADNTFTLQAAGLPVNQFGFFVNSTGQAYIPNPGGSQGALCLGGGASIGRHSRPSEIGFSGAAGIISLTLDLTDLPTATGPYMVLAGDTWNFQCWFRDVNPGATANFTSGLSVRFE